MLLNIVENAKKHFPKLQIKYKDKSLFMKIISKFLFFNKGFSTTYTTTIGNTIYFPNEDFVKVRSLSSIAILLHELVHIYDSKNIFYNFLYLFPQILSLIILPFVLFNWYFIFIFLFFLLPLPAYFRMYYEKRAYIMSLYVISVLGKKLNFEPRLDEYKNIILKEFKGPTYYYMWLFSLDKEFDIAIEKIKNNEHPYDDMIFSIIDDLIIKLEI